MRRIVMSGLVALAAGLGSAGAAAAAPAPARAVAMAVTRVGVAPAWMRSEAAVGGGFFFSAGSNISCGSPKTCLAIGMSVNAHTVTSAPFVKVWNGTAWKPVAVPTPKAGISAEVTGVSCRSATSCLVIGDYVTAADAQRPYAMTWNGTSLTPTAAVPASNFTFLLSVSCATARGCVAVGMSLGATSGSVRLSVETWNGTRWALRTAKIPGDVFAEPTAIRCFTITSCVIAGTTVADTGTANEKMLLATWNDRTLRAMKAAPAVPKSSIISLSGLSCASRKSCVAVGFTLNSTGTDESGFAEGWNGTSWRADRVSWPKADPESLLSAISCAMPSRCTAVGTAGTLKSGAAKALSWNGRTWSQQPVPGPGKGQSSSFGGVSCPAVSDCVAFGGTGATSGASSTPLSGVWNGRSWRLVAA